LTNCHDVPLSGLPPLDFCATAEVNKAETMTTLANINVLRLALVFIEAAFLSIPTFWLTSLAPTARNMIARGKREARRPWSTNRISISPEKGRNTSFHFTYDSVF
jgi:hypothetical protein